MHSVNDRHVAQVDFLVESYGGTSHFRSGGVQQLGHSLVLSACAPCTYYPHTQPRLKEQRLCMLLFFLACCLAYWCNEWDLTKYTQTIVFGVVVLAWRLAIIEEGIYPLAL